MKYIFFFIALISLNSNAQNVLKFDKRNVQCEDKWVAFQMDKDSTYSYGFIYIDSQAGLTLNHEGSFKIDKKGKFKKIESETRNDIGFIKARLEPSRIAIAEIPESKFKELKIEKTPDWLKTYKTHENEVEALFKKGFNYNAWGEFEKALISLEKANKIDFNYKGLQTELAYSYNALEQFDKAEIALKKAIKENPKDCYSLKELAYTYNHLSNIEKSIEVYTKMASLCTEKNYIQEAAFNIAAAYYEKKDKIKFNYWNKETRKWSTNSNQLTKYLDKFEEELNK